METRVVDDQDQPLPAGEVGEIVHRSPHAMLGYYRDEDKTAQAFRNGWFHSGDLGHLDAEGRLPKPGATLTEQQVIEHTRAHLAGYKTPKHVVVTDALPKNPSGKIVKRQLRDEHAAIAAGDA